MSPAWAPPKSGANFPRRYSAACGNIFPEENTYVEYPPGEFEMHFGDIAGQRPILVAHDLKASANVLMGNGVRASRFSAKSTDVQDGRQDFAGPGPGDRRMSSGWPASAMAAMVCRAARIFRPSICDAGLSWESICRREIRARSAEPAKDWTAPWDLGPVGMSDDVTIAGVERLKRIERLVSRWDEHQQGKGR